MLDFLLPLIHCVSSEREGCVFLGYQSRAFCKHREGEDGRVVNISVPPFLYMRFKQINLFTCPLRDISGISQSLPSRITRW